MATKPHNPEVQDDGVWMTASSFTIFTMTAGFGLLESGRVSSKDEVNVMVKNVIDVIFGGLAYWMFGYGFTFGESNTNPFIGVGDYFFDPEREDMSASDKPGTSYALFLFQMSFATTTSTIVSAGMAERIHLQSHCFVSFFITLVHSVAGHWVWHRSGVFRAMGVVDSAGCSAVHLVGGISGLVATLYLRPRQYRFMDKRARQISDPTKAILGFLMIWWGWLAFNTASNYSVSRRQWTEGARSAVGTVMASAGGGMMTILISRYTTKKIQVDMLIDGMLASLVSSTAGCLFYTPWQATVVGAVGSAMALVIYPLLEKAQIDDPVGVVPVHVVGSVWGMISPAIFICRDFGLADHQVTNENDLSGVLYGGGVTLLLYQLAALGAIAFFSGSCAFLILFFVEKILQHSPIGLRLSRLDEELGADLREHGLAGVNVMTYTIEKKLTAETLSAVLMVIVRWRAKAKLGALRRRRIAAAVGPSETERGIEMMRLQKRRDTLNLVRQAITQA
ncbi:hypothetical protein RB195_000826 [Necator americanus]|uniref:Ammonium transporter AmtB-like domain-containing protein n=1 Tax=Necator americanus TaxID=51031 RepID=A0ABR1DC72_NECAM